MRQYLREGFYPLGYRDAGARLEPSAALVKALLLNGAVLIVRLRARLPGLRRHPARGREVSADFRQEGPQRSAGVLARILNVQPATASVQKEPI